MNIISVILRMMKEVTPPGMEPVVRALKKKPGIDNPWAVAWSMYGQSDNPFSKKKGKKQANAGNALANLLRGIKSNMTCSESGTIREARTEKMETSDGSVREGHVVEVILINEGLGNRHNMNYYGPEAIETAPGVFEGKSCFFDHPSETEERDLPERRVRQKCGYFKNCRIETIEGKKTCVGELHFDLSEDGEQAYQKACTALHYRDEFPAMESEYVGLSINADGDWEDRTVQWEGETLQVNYVTKFRDAMSCDIVTSPARGGRFLALVESAAGANPKKEVGPMKKGLKKSLEAAQTALKDAVKESDLEKKAKLLEEADKKFSAFLKEAAKAAYQDENESESESEDDEMKSKSEDESESEKKSSEKKSKDDSEESEDEDGDGEEEADDAPDDDKKKDDDDDTVESHRIAITSMAKEAGVALSKWRIHKLAQISLKEAKAEIADLKWVQESIAKKVIQSIKVPTMRLDKLTESNRDTSEESDFLTSCLR